VKDGLGAALGSAPTVKTVGNLMRLRNRRMLLAYEGYCLRGAFKKQPC